MLFLGDYFLFWNILPFLFICLKSTCNVIPKIHSLFSSKVIRSIRVFKLSVDSVKQPNSSWPYPLMKWPIANDLRTSRICRQFRMAYLHCFNFKRVRIWLMKNLGTWTFAKDLCTTVYLSFEYIHRKQLFYSSGHLSTIYIEVKAEADMLK